MFGTELPLETEMEDQNTMEKVLGTFDGYLDNATSLVRGVTEKTIDKAGELAGDAGSKAGDAAGKAGTVIGENIESIVTFAKGFFGG
ncbi:hypothetical protein N9368_03515 [Alphaproteobacteria bacterium]|nr:hypothetical protein [Alphaproteobacteria bacterium]